MNEPKQYSEERKEAIRVVSKNKLIVFTGFVNINYEPDWVHREIANQLERVERGEIKRLMICVPPRIGKSELASINFPAWYLGRHPEKEVIVSSYSADLAQDFGYKTRNLVNTSEYQDIFDTRLMDDSKSKAKWLTQEKGGYTSSGVGGAITGRGADLFIIDDPVKNREEAESKVYQEKAWGWYKSTAYTRLEKGAAIVLVMTRWNKGDLGGRILEAMENGGEEWTVVKFPAIATTDEKNRKKGEALWPDKYDLAALENIKKTVGPYDWSALYQQEPMSAETQEFKEVWFKPISLDDVSRMKSRNFATIDTAISKKDEADFTGATVNFVNKENKWHFITYKLKINAKELIDFLFMIWNTYNLEVIGIEEGIYLLVIKPFLDEEMRKRNKFLIIIPLKHKKIDKNVRIRALIPRYETGSIYHIKGMCKDLESELLEFPKGANDDVCDSAAYQIQIAKVPDENSGYKQPPAEPSSRFEEIPGRAGDPFDQFSSNNMIA